MSRGDPHDHLFRYGFGQPEVARAHFERYLPAALVSAVDWSGLEEKSESFVDEKLKFVESDLLYQAPLKAGGELLLYVLFEHQRRLDYQMPLRLLQYMVRIWVAWQAQHGARFRKPQLPPIVPMVLYNGHQRWTVSDRFRELFPAGPVRDAMGAWIPDFRYDLLDLSQTPDADIQGAAMGEMSMLLFKWADKEDFWQRLPAWLETMQTILENPDNGIANVEALLRYIMSVAAGSPPDELRPQLRHHLTPRVEETLMTWAEQLKQQGVEQGISQGISQGLNQGQIMERRALLEKLLTQRFGPLSEAHRHRIQKADYDQLGAWVDGVLSVTSVQEALAMS